MSHGFFKGTSVGQDSRFGDKERKLIEQTQFPEEYSRQVDLKKVKIAVIEPWITQRITELMGGVEDEILVSFVMNQLEENPLPDAKLLQINITGFLGKKSEAFTRELWNLLLSAQDNSFGIPQQLIDARKEQLRSQQGVERANLDEIERVRRVAEDRIRAQSKVKREREDNSRRTPERSPKRERKERSRSPPRSPPRSDRSRSGNHRKRRRTTSPSPERRDNSSRGKHRRDRSPSPSRRDDHSRRRDDSHRGRHDRHRERKRERSPENALRESRGESRREREERGEKGSRWNGTAGKESRRESRQRPGRDEERTSRSSPEKQTPVRNREGSLRERKEVAKNISETISNVHLDKSEEELRQEALESLKKEKAGK